MKRIIPILILSLFIIKAAGQKAEQILPGARVSKPVSYYKEQAVAWKKMVDEHPKDANAWYNYYYAHRHLLYHDNEDKRSIKERNDFVQQLVEDMGKALPESYEYNFCKWMAGGYDMSLLPYLEKAAAIGKDRTEHLDYMISTNEISRNIKNRDLYSKKKFEGGQFSTGVIYYNYNVMAGLNENAILITDGDNDTYPVWLLQAQDIRKDITIINLNLMGLAEYRNSLFDALGIERWKDMEDPKAGKTEADHERYRNGIIKHIAANKKNYPVYVALTSTGREKIINPVKQNLYLTGLAYLYSEKPVDNIALLKRNVEQQFALDYIDKAFYADISPDMVKHINGNYLVPLLTLYDHYVLAGDNQKEEWAKTKVLAISKDTENEMEVKKHVARGH